VPLIQFIKKNVNNVRKMRFAYAGLCLILKEILNIITLQNLIFRQNLRTIMVEEELAKSEPHQRD
jgi:hypothetical protein